MIKVAAPNMALKIIDDAIQAFGGAAQSMGSKIETGTFFMNRCDYLDPGLAWTGVKDTGIGVTLSVLGFELRFDFL